MIEPNSFVAECALIPAQGVESLVWTNGKLMDWVSGDVEYALDGSKRGPTITFPYRFDAAISSPSGRFIALYERLGTKAVILGPNDMFREINRSYYHAHIYEYPILFLRLPDGREVLAHCPEEYCDLRLEDPVTGSPLTESGAGRIESLFHSRLFADPYGSRILSAGWLWHPFDTVAVFDLVATSNGQLELSQCHECWNQSVEISSASFNHRGQLIAISGMAATDYRKNEPGARQRPGTIGVYDLDSHTMVSLAPLEEEAGTIIPVGSEFIIGLYDHPKLIEVATGRVLHRWTQLNTGQQNSSIMWHKPLPPPIAYDSETGRLAVAEETQIVVVSLATSLLQ